jgi:hypothetical protein
MKEKKYSGLHGFENGAPAFPSSSWASVDLFLHTWGFLPNDNEALKSLTKDQLIDLCIASMHAASHIDLEGKNIKKIQELLHQFKLSPNSSKEK